MNILSKLPALIGRDVAEPTPAELEAEAKADRIKFHRENVRNGPVKFKTPTTGQLRRERSRMVDGMARKARRKQIRNYLQTQRLASSVRGHLQAARVLSYVHAETSVSDMQQALSVAWLVNRFGTEDENGITSFAYQDVLDALESALKFYGQAVGIPDLRVPSDYVVPVYERGTEPA